MNELTMSSAMDLSFLSEESHESKPNDQNNIESVKRKRGRPRTKPILPVELDAEGNPIKKKRGRPKKILTEPNQESSNLFLQSKSGSPLEENVPVVKKRRGRPRKSLINPTTIAFVTETSKNETHSISGDHQDKDHLRIGDRSDTNKRNPVLLQPKKRDINGDIKKTEKPQEGKEGIQNGSQRSEPTDKPELERHDPSIEEAPALNENPEPAKPSSVTSELSIQKNQELDNKGKVPESRLQTAEPSKPEKPHKKRGRPRKNPAENMAPKIKRPRGRPPKPKSQEEQFQNQKHKQRRDSKERKGTQDTDERKQANIKEYSTNLTDILRDNSQQKGISSTSPKKKIKLAKTITQQTFNDSKESHVEDTNAGKAIEKNKDVFLNFKKNQEKATKPNNILDDSYDVFSFDNNGTSNFIIPEEALPVPNNAKNKNPKTTPMKPLQEQLEHIDTTNIEFSDDDDYNVEDDDSKKISESEKSSDESYNSENDAYSDISSSVPSPSSPNDDSLRHLPSSVSQKQSSIPESQAAFEHEDQMPQGLDSRPLSIHNSEKTPRKLSEEWSLSISFQDVNGQGTPDASPSRPKEIISAFPSSPNISPKVKNTINSDPEPEKVNEKAVTEHRTMRNTPIKTLPSWSPLDNDRLRTLTEDTITLNKYFTDLLIYMNKNSATLASDATGELSFFINQMPKHETSLNFCDWVDRKGMEVYRQLEKGIDEKIEEIKLQFQKAKELINQIDDDTILLEFAERFNIDI